MKKEYKHRGIAPIITAAVFVLAFSLALALAITSLGSAAGGVKTAREAPDSLVSAGAPRSQLELKRMFESMSLSYTENGREIYEPISPEYLASVNDGSLLAVEEILFIISDTSLAYEKYDVIRFRNAASEIEREIEPRQANQTAEMPFHRSARERLCSVVELIRLRIEYMSGEGSVKEVADGSYRYEPRRVERDNDGGSGEQSRAFLFGDASIVFEAEGGKTVSLYPKESETVLCRTKVVAVTDIEIAESEGEILSSAGYDPTRCRNITPEYWYGRTAVRLFVFGGRVIISDSGSAWELLPEGYKLTSAALGERELYFTASSDSGSSVLKYADGEVEKIFGSDEKYLAVIEPLDGSYGSVEVYAARQTEDGRFVVALECVGEPIEKYSAE